MIESPDSPHAGVRSRDQVMPSEGSITCWISRLQAGDPAAVQSLWERYFHRLIGLARHRLRNAPRQAADEEDVALSAFDSFCRTAERGRFPGLLDRDSLWRLLVVVTARKAAHLVRDEGRQKRGGPGSTDDPAELERLLSREPDPAFAAQVAEECGRLLERLRDPQLESVALRRMEGFSVDEIAARLGCAPRSVKRKLQLIRTLWDGEDTP
jgi:DNA-directed RNA polymerase specialized sigma24 family protein